MPDAYVDIQSVKYATGKDGVDSVTNALEIIDYPHHEIHTGGSFLACHSAGSKNDGDTISIYLKTPNTTKWLHMLAEFTASGAAYFRIYEAPTITANTGTNGQVAYNHNRNSATASTIVDNATSPAAGKYGVDVTKTGNGTIIEVKYSGASKSNSASLRSVNELILKQNTAYLFEVESDAASLVLGLCLNWYEHTNRN